MSPVICRGFVITEMNHFSDELHSPGDLSTSDVLQRSSLTGILPEFLRLSSPAAPSLIPANIKLSSLLYLPPSPFSDPSHLFSEGFPARFDSLSLFGPPVQPSPFSDPSHLFSEGSPAKFDSLRASPDKELQQDVWFSF
ncbi:hypothetical protein HHK36_004707 [Tetracentron sinense]|uniref:Uncharacterized protein n=1 Tax=Tetracentron sinense TaxID=13715 RepID=A0A835DLT0_TETSI|nr:hypothetical protein HHK36_004707 [Tetracentron sinense]